MSSDRVVYKITNMVNGKIYVGQDTYNRPDYYGSGKIIKHALQKYGKDAFKKEILCHCNSAIELDEQEKFWIEILDSRNPEIGYNIQTGGRGQSGDEYRKSMSQSLTGVKNPMYGISLKTMWSVKYGNDAAEKMWEEANERRASSQRGKKKERKADKSELSKKLSLLRKGRKNCNGLQRKVIVDGIIYNSMSEAAMNLNKTVSYIRCRCISEKHKNFEFA